jgi:hypothetical protein
MRYSVIWRIISSYMENNLKFLFSYIIHNYMALYIELQKKNQIFKSQTNLKISKQILNHKS